MTELNIYFGLKSMVAKHITWDTAIGKLCMVVILLLIFNHVRANEKIHKIRWVTPFWTDYTSHQETGFYHDIVSAAFTHADVVIEVQERPFKRALKMVEVGDADMVGLDEISVNLTHAQYPTLTSSEVVLYRILDIPVFEDISALNRKVGVWYAGYIENIPQLDEFHFVGFEVNDRQKALAMLVNENRKVSYYFDSDAQLKQALSKSNLVLDDKTYAIKPLFSVDLYMLFSRTPRGERIRELYNEGIAKAYCSDQLAMIYQQWKQSLPELDIDCATISQW